MEGRNSPFGGGAVETRLLPIITVNKEEKEKEIIVIEDSPLRPLPPKTLDHQNAKFPDLSGLQIQPKPVKEMKPVHPFFAAKPTVVTTLSKQKPTKNEDSPLNFSGNQVPSWPNFENAHCGFPEYIPTAQPPVFPPSRKRFASGHRSSSSKSISSRKTRELPILANLTVPTSNIDERPSSDNSLNPLDILPKTHREHSAITRLFAPHSKFPSNRSWNDKYAPMKAHEVLHNGENAIYLRSWFKALEIQLETTGASEGSRGLKRPRLDVQRVVARKRRKRSGELDDFLAGDDDIEDEFDEELNLGNDDDDDEGYLSIGTDLPRASTISTPLSSRFPSPAPPPLIIPRGTRSRPSARRIIESSPPSSPRPPVQEPPPTVNPPNEKAIEAQRPPFTERLTNTILLKGPHGSGKTAAVYACAQELDWKVFEFYPGIGKRSGAGFMSEVGGTGENHRVGGIAAHMRSQSPEVETHSFSQAQGFGFMTSPSKKFATRASPAPSHANSEREGGTDVRQSLILVEEADILYQSDGNFWPTLVNFIRKSRRPVVITCNDVSLIPIHELPLQSILEFEACEKQLATSYLQAIALVEGCPVSREAAYSIYTHEGVYYPPAVDIPDQPMHPLPGQGFLILQDLKRAINQLQFHCVTGKPNYLANELDYQSLADWNHEPAVMPDQMEEEVPKYYRNTAPHEDLEQLLQLSEFIEAISFSDAYVDRRLKSTLELECTDRYGTNADDVQGHTLLYKMPEPEEAFGVALWPRDRDMAVSVAYQARLRLEQRGNGQMARRGLMAQRVVRRSTTTTGENSGEDDTGELGSEWGFDTLHLALRRAAYQRTIVEPLDEKLGCAGPLMPQPGCTLDYIPYMQEMVRRMQGYRGWMTEGGLRVLKSETLKLPK